MYTQLFDDFLVSGDSLQVYEGNRLVFASNKDGITPLLEYAASLSSFHQQVIIFDKIMGNAAALLSVKVHGQEVYSPLGSELAIRTLDKFHLKYHLNEIVRYIQKPGGQDMCPMERLSLDKSPEEFYEAVKKIMSSRQQVDS